MVIFILLSQWTVGFADKFLTPGTYVEHHQVSIEMSEGDLIKSEVTIRLDGKAFQVVLPDHANKNDYWWNVHGYALNYIVSKYIYYA